MPTILNCFVVLCLHLAGLYFFVNGFLLSRTEIPHTNTCESTTSLVDMMVSGGPCLVFLMELHYLRVLPWKSPSKINASSITSFPTPHIRKAQIGGAFNSSNADDVLPGGDARSPEHPHGCGFADLPKFEHIVIVVIDALRFDFAVFNESLGHLPTERASEDDGENAAESNAGETHDSDDGWGAGSGSNKKKRPHIEFYQNALPSLHKAVKEKPDQARLFRFIADSPTVTQQRLKGLTTGSLPTFIDIKDSFASVAITEDNWLAQMARFSRNAVHMGDDTWTQLFPTAFVRGYPYPSFNVFDLHTVDNGCNEHLHDELAKDDWTVLIAHYLGVDHVGHRYHPNHPAMRQKLLQMNDVLDRLMQKVLDMDSTLLMVLGDHGMTSSGDHGGATMEETDAALFMFSSDGGTFPPERFPIPGRKRSDTKESLRKFPSVYQTDLVPTLSLLLDLPIPFGNLGALIPELFLTPNAAGQRGGSSASALTRLRTLVSSYRHNAVQVEHFLQQYAQTTGAFSRTFLAETSETLRDLLTLHDEVSAKLLAPSEDDDAVEHDLRSLASRYATFLQGARTHCVEQWLTFDYVLMGEGIAILLFTVLVNIGLWLRHKRLVISGNEPQLSRRHLVYVVAAGAISSAVFFSVLRKGSVSHFVGAFFAGATFALGVVLVHPLFRDSWSALRSHPKRFLLASLDAPTTVMLVTAAVYMQGLFSNSFILAEESVVFYVLQSMIVAIGVGIARESKRPRLSALKYVAALLALVRVIPMVAFTSEGLSPDDFFSGPQFLLTFVPVIVLELGLGKFLRDSGNLDAVWTICPLIVISSVSMFTFWFSNHRASEASPTPPMSLVWLPRVCYAFAALSISVLAYQGRACVSVVKPLYAGYDGSVQATYEFLKKNPNGVQRTIEYYGVPTNYFVSALLLLAAGAPILMTVLGPRSPMMFLLSAGIIHCLTHVSTGDFHVIAVTDGSDSEMRGDQNGVESNGSEQEAHQNSSNTTQRKRKGVSASNHDRGARGSSTSALNKESTIKVTFNPLRLSLAELWIVWLLGVVLFFATGHSNVFSSINFACTHGFPHFNFWASGTLVMLNTFAGYVVALLALVCVALGRVYFLPRSNSSARAYGNELSRLCVANAAHALLGVSIFSSLRVTFSAVDALVQRRHLMSYEIFTPKFIFDASACVFCDFVCLFLLAFVYRLDAVFRNYLTLDDKKAR